MILHWLKSKRSPGSSEPESPSRTAVRERLASKPSALLIADALERFPELEPGQAHSLVRDVVEEFFFEVMDVGASESYHHATPWGLAEHSLEVAVTALRVARSRHFVGHAAPNPEEEAHRLPRLRYACFLFALYHDLGKILQATVLGPDRTIHNPFVEPLGAFYDRHGGDECRIEWREGRGLEDHIQLGSYLVGHILPRTAAGYLGPLILSEVIEGKSQGASEIREVIADADQQSVRENRRSAEAAGSGYASGSFVAYLAKSFAEGLKQGRLTVNTLKADVLVGQRFAFFAYTSGVLKLLALVKECFGRSDVAARMLGEDEGGARFFLAKLKADEGLFTDPLTGLWKLKAAIQDGGASDVKEGVLIPLAHLGLAGDGMGPFAGSIAFSRPADGSEVVIDDFVPRPPTQPAAAPAPAVPPIVIPAARPREEPPAPPPVPATLGPQTTAPPGGIDPEELVEHLIEGITEGWIPANVSHAQVYVGPKTTFAITPAIFMRMRERGLYPDFDPRDPRSHFLRSLARLDFVRKSTFNRIVYAIMLGPESERPIKVIKFDTLGLFKSQELRNRVGIWKDCERIVELPPGWTPGDPVFPDEEESE